VNPHGTGDLVLDVRDLSAEVFSENRRTTLLRGVSVQVRTGETLAVVGESGAGKSLMALSVMGLLPSTIRVSGGSIKLAGQELVGLPERQMRRLRGAEMAMVYQDPMTSLNPLMRIGAQLAEAAIVHGVSRARARTRAIEMLDRVGIPSPTRVARSYPHELSGGMRQRVVIALALMNRPRLLVADEPTTALDATVQQQIITLVADLQRELDLAVVWVTHDLSVVTSIADSVVVMYAGRVVERAATTTLFERPRHHYTAGLLASAPAPSRERPRLPQIGGLPPDLAALPLGCPFHPRCPEARSACRESEPPLAPVGPSLAACHYPDAESRIDAGR
jgi:oligopeptide/dipeptide ABC transporter ATP-binding protein